MNRRRFLLTLGAIAGAPKAMAAKPVTMWTWRSPVMRPAGLPADYSAWGKAPMPVSYTTMYWGPAIPVSAEMIAWWKGGKWEGPP